MTSSHRGPNHPDGSRGSLDPGTLPPVPRWVKLSLLVFALLVLVLLVVMMLLPGEHGPSRHIGGERPVPADAPDSATAEKQAEPWGQADG